MLRVIKKDLILGRKVLLVNAAIFGLFLTYFATGAEDLSPGFYAGMASLMIAFLPAGLVIREDKFDAMTLQCSLPVSRKTIVQARFVLAEGMALAGVLTAFLYGGLVPFSQFRVTDFLSPAPLLTGVALVTLVLSLILPFSLRFGAKGLMIFLVFTQVLGVVLLTIVMMTNSSVDQRIVEAIIGFFVRTRGSLGGPGFGAALLGFLGVLYALSYLLSIRIFENRDL